MSAQKNTEPINVRSFPAGPEPVSETGVHMGAPAAYRHTAKPATASHRRRAIPSDYLIEIELQTEGNGYVSAMTPDTRAGTGCRHLLDDGLQTHPDPASRFQPQAAHGPSQRAEPFALSTDADGPGIEHNRKAPFNYLGDNTPVQRGVKTNLFYPLSAGKFASED